MLQFQKKKSSVLKLQVWKPSWLSVHLNQLNQLKLFSVPKWKYSFHSRFKMSKPLYFGLAAEVAVLLGHWAALPICFVCQ